MSRAENTWYRNIRTESSLRSCARTSIAVFLLPRSLALANPGNSGTGVAYSNLSIGSDTVRWVQKWPGRFQANENKVPTVVVYPVNSPDPSSWGFLSETIAETTAQDKEYKEWFKTCLDPKRLALKQKEDPEGAPESLEEVEKWYADYLRKVSKT